MPCTLWLKVFPRETGVNYNNIHDGPIIFAATINGHALKTIARNFN